jgi:hypothetical protein
MAEQLNQERRISILSLIAVRDDREYPLPLTKEGFCAILKNILEDIWLNTTKL